MSEHFDYLVIGGGSGGVSSARRAAAYGKSVALIEKTDHTGGTCVNVGCVPKKVMFCAASVMEAAHAASNFGIETGPATLDWGLLKRRRDAYIRRLNGIYDNNLGKAGIKLIRGAAKFVGPKQVAVGDATYTADHILIAVGGYPRMPTIPGAEHCITSDGFFELEEQPKRVAVVGGGYIAVEMAGIFKAMGSEVTVYVRRKNGLLSAFDRDLAAALGEEMTKAGINLRLGFQPDSLEKNADGTITVHVGDETSVVDCALYAIGREPATGALDLEKAGVTANEKGIIEADAKSFTSAEGVYAVGDVLGIADLTPVAIKAGRTLADYLFGGKPSGDVDYSNIPTVVFSHPPLGTVGLTEDEAAEKHGADNLIMYRSKFTNLYYGPWEMDAADKPKTFMKVVTLKGTDEVVGIHVMGLGADEMIQGFGVAMVAAQPLTKPLLDATTAVHPSSAEELVTFGPWGWAGEKERKAALDGAGAGAGSGSGK